MHRIMKPQLSPPVARCLLAAALLAFHAPAMLATGLTYYVATNGSDTNNGRSTNTPFRTIQKAATLAVAGDTVNIRAGTYRETVTPSNSGTDSAKITYQNYRGEAVTITGADPITAAWSVDAGNIYRTTVALTKGERNQVFVDGAAMVLARWPNGTNSTFMDQQSLGTVQSSSGGTITDTNLSDAEGFYQGASVAYTDDGLPQYHWVYYKGKVAASGGGLGHSLKLAKGPSGPGGLYWLFGSRNLLDAPREWYYDSTNAQLYLYTPEGDSPATHRVEVKARDYSFDLSGKSHLNLTGINTFGCGLLTDESSSYNTIDGMTADYVYHNLGTSAFGWDGDTYSSGIVLKGGHNTFKHCTVDNSSNNGITVMGHDNAVINCHVHDCNYNGSGATGILFNGQRSFLSHCTVHDTGRANVLFGAFAGKIQFCEFYNSDILCGDSGNLYTANVDYGNSEVAYNIFHDDKGLDAGGCPLVGIYFDDQSSNVTIHHNVIYNANNGDGMAFNGPNHALLVYNNTVIGHIRYQHTTGDNQKTNANNRKLSQCCNNIVTGEVRDWYRDGALKDLALDRNTTGNASLAALFVDAPKKNFRLKPGSPAIDSGKNVPGITDGYAGGAPDQGAYEHDGADWTAGYNFSNPPNPTYSIVNTAYMNRVVNGGFEYTYARSTAVNDNTHSYPGDPSDFFYGWTRTDAKAAAVVDGKWKTQCAVTGNFGLRVGSAAQADGVMQTVTGLSPKTTYQVMGSLRVDASSEQISLGVRNYGGSETNQAVTATNFTEVSFRFTTGKNNASAELYVTKPAGRGFGYADTLFLVQALEQ